MSADSNLDVSLLDDEPRFTLAENSENDGALELEATLGELGLDDDASDQEVAEAVDSLVLSLNLCSDQGVFSTQSPIKHLPDIDRVPSEVEPVTVEEASDGTTTIELTETVPVREEVAVTVTQKEEIHSAEVMEVFERIQSHKRLSTGTNGLKALDKVRAAARTHDIPHALDRYAAAIELLVNADRANQVRGQALDEEVVRRTSVPEATARDIRQLYNRNKHPDRTEREEQQYQALMEDADTLVVSAKTAVAELAQDVL